MPSSDPHSPCLLALEDGTFFRGRRFGANLDITGEIVFNTAMTGYQEILTDPSYRGQVVVMTYPHIGNYGVNAEDLESGRPHVAGFILRDSPPVFSNYRAAGGLGRFLREHGIAAVTDVDTRAITRHIREQGAMRCAIHGAAEDPRIAVEAARNAPAMEGCNLVNEVAPKAASFWTEGFATNLQKRREGKRRLGTIVAVDCGMKRNILRHLVDVGAERVEVVPPSASAAEILERKPAGVFVSNGPGDPAVVTDVIMTLKAITGRVPIFGICLGHQLLALALGGASFKLKFGHRGANQPVRNLQTGRVEITSQNHGFAIDAESLQQGGAITTHVNLNDRTLEGFCHPGRALFAVQYHPEASPGPHDASYLFDCFARMIETGRAPTGEDMAQAQNDLARRQATPVARQLP